MTVIIQVISAFVGSACFALLFNVKKDKLLYGGLGGAFAWICYLVLGIFISSDIVRYVITSALFTANAEALAVKKKTPALVFIVPSAVPLFPGSLLYHTMEAAVDGDWTLFRERGVHTIGLAVSISCGILLTMTLLAALKRGKEKIHTHDKHTDNK